jgi:His-Xaa-Ser system radical SAM maturase HxsC
MIRLYSRGEAKSQFEDVRLGRITTTPVAPKERADHAFLIGPSTPTTDLAGYAGIVVLPGAAAPTAEIPITQVNEDLAYLADGDVVLMAPSGRVSVLYRRSSRHNTILSTERCNSLCLMCSQPPQLEDDSHRVKEILRLVELIDTGCVELGISGGEPLLLGDGFFAIVEKCKEHLPKTALHVLTNGRLFKDPNLAQRLGAIGHPDAMLGIPLYADVDTIHDYVVQARGAFDETLQGLYNLAQRGVPIEIRVVLHAQTYRRLPQLAEFIYRNFPFVTHVALMGLEMFGYTNINIGDLWIDPVDYQPELRAATLALAERGLNVSIYNHQLCTIPQDLWPFARQSISDWKNIFVPECEGCQVRDACAGFFHSAAKRHSAHIKPPSVHPEVVRALLNAPSPSADAAATDS